MFKVAAFYKFTPLEDIAALRAEVRHAGAAYPELCGTILLAPEGINGTIAARPDHLDTFVDYLDRQFGIRSNDIKYSEAAEAPFNRFKVRPKKEIITMRCAEANPNEQVGDYVEPKDWNALIDDPDVTVVDTRNDYETRVGIFDGAIDPQLAAFTDFSEFVRTQLDPQKNKKIAMYCTGGIRCEKASAYMLAAGFEEVFHLKGGILKYLEEVPSDQSKWRGDCFVFDKRVAVGQGLAEGDWSMCFGCREPLSPDDRARDDYEEGVCCLYCVDELTPERADALRMRHQQMTAEGR